MRPRSFAFAFVVSSALASSLVPSSAEAAGGVVPLSGRPDPSYLDVRVAIAASPKGTTRWNEVTLPAATRALWLVPVRPGGTIAWAQDAWLPALEDATAPRILRPSFASSCVFPTNPERATSWTTAAVKHQPDAYVVHASASSVRDAANAGGFAISTALDARIASLYADGWNLAALEIQSNAGTASSGTLRVHDDGGAAVPLALVGTRSADTRVTAFVIGAGVASTPGTRDADGTALRWGSSGSNFLAWRRDILAGGAGDVWLRESASHAALFDGTTVTASTPAPSVVTRYLGSTTCATGARDAGGSDGVVGESIPSSTFSCYGFDDLAVALDGLAPRSAVITRFTGIVPRGSIGDDRALAFDVNGFQSSPVIHAGAYDSCITGSGSSSSGTPDRPLAPGPGGGDVPDDHGTDVVYVSDGCGGGTTTTTTYEEDETTTTTSSEDDCGGDTSTSSSSSDSSDSSDGWDTSDSSDDSGDSCGSDSESSSSSSDSCGSGSSSSSGGGSDDGWDTEDEMSPKAKKQSLRLRPKHSKSPFSRFALFAVALILPLRRRARAALRA